MKTESIPAGTITKIGAEYRDDESGTKTKFVIYSDNGGNPGQLLAYTNEFYPQETDGWEDQQIAYAWDGSSYVSSSTYVTTGGTLWAGYWADGDSSLYSGCGDMRQMHSQTYSDTQPPLLN